MEEAFCLWNGGGGEGGGGAIIDFRNGTWNGVELMPGEWMEWGQHRSLGGNGDMGPPTG